MPPPPRETDLRLLVHLDLGDQPAGRRIPSGEVDAGGLPDHTRPPSHRRGSRRRPAVGQLHIDAGAVLHEPGDFLVRARSAPPTLRPGGQDALEVALPGATVVVAGGEVADVQRDPANAWTCDRLPLGEEPFGDAALIEHLDGPRAGRGAAIDLLARAPLTIATSIPPAPTRPPASCPSALLRRSPPHARSYTAPLPSLVSGWRFCAPTGALLQAPGARLIESGKE